MEFITSIFTDVLLYLYSLTGNLGFTIIGFTIIMRLLLLPLTLPSIKAQNQIKKLQPEIKALKKIHGKDKKALQVAQMELYKKYNVNPLAGCLPQLLQIGVLILLYQVLNSFLRQDEVNGTVINPMFLWLDLGAPDPRYVIPVLAAGTQLILSLMIAPGAEVKDDVPNESKLPAVKEENKKEEDIAEMAATMQQQMLFIMPLMTGFIALSFPSGLGLYWVATTVVSVVQQYFVSGPGGIVMYYNRARLFIMRRMATSATTDLADDSTVYQTPAVVSATGKKKAKAKKKANTSSAKKKVVKRRTK